MWIKYIQIVYTTLVLTGVMILGSCDLNGFWGASESNASNEQEGSVGSYRTNVVGDGCYTVHNGIIITFHHYSQYTAVGNKEKDCFTETLEIPESVGGQAITAIAVRVFDGSGRTKKLRSVRLPDSIETIGSYAFVDNELEELAIPASVKTIGDYAFSKNKLSGKLSIPDSVEYIGDYAFTDNVLSNVRLGSSMQASKLNAIGEAAFKDNRLSGSLSIPDSVEYIGGHAFVGEYYTSKTGNMLTRLVLGSSMQASKLKTIGEWTFYRNNLEGSLDIPNRVETIGESAFAHNNLMSVSISKSVKKIWEKAFDGNPTTSITIDPYYDPPVTLTIGNNAFPNRFDAAYNNPYDKPRGTWTYSNNQWDFSEATQ